MNENGTSVPIRIVELLISNINELTKQVQALPNQITSDISADLERLTVATTAIITKIGTPPRNEELDRKLDETLECLSTEVIEAGTDEIKKLVVDEATSIKKLVTDRLITPVKRMTLSVWLVTGFLGVALLISSIVVTINNKDIVQEIKGVQHYEQIYSRLEQYKKVLERVAPQELEKLNHTK